MRSSLGVYFFVCRNFAFSSIFSHFFATFCHFFATFRPFLRTGGKKIKIFKKWSTTIFCPNLCSNLSKFQLSSTFPSRLLFKNVILRYRNLKVAGPDFFTFLAINPSKIPEIGKICAILEWNRVCPMEIHIKTCLGRFKGLKWVRKGHFYPFWGLFFYITEYGQNPNFGSILAKPCFTSKFLSRERTQIFTFRKKRWAHKKIHFHISLTCKNDPWPPLSP